MEVLNKKALASSAEFDLAESRVKSMSNSGAPKLSQSFLKGRTTMRKTVSIILGFAIVLWLALPATTVAQQKVSLQSLAHGTGTLIADRDEYKITGVLVILRENGEAEFTLFTDMQLYGQGRWSAGKDLSQGIDLKITGGVFKNEKDAKGTGKLFLRADGKSIATLTIEGTRNTGGSFKVGFVADDKKEAQP